MKRKYILVAVVAALLSGCAVVDITKTSKGFYDKTDANEIEILKTRPERSYEELGTVTASGFALTESAKMHNAIRTKAAALGANAVILTEEGVIPDGWGSARRWATGVAIRYK
jgi:type IV pilus biogenesis protein CpaD/CtpE